MLLGKCPGPLIRRTTSMAGITVDVTKMEASQPSDYQTITAVYQNSKLAKNNVVRPRTTTIGYEDEHSRTPSKSNILDMGNNYNDFLRICSLCNRQLGHGRDIYMYRGDRAFCSLECREKQMKQDKRKEKNHVGSHTTGFRPL